MQNARRVAERSTIPRQPGADRENVLVGRNGWLFLCNDGNDVLGQYTGRVRLSKEHLDDWSALIEARMELAAELDVTWLTSIVPYKEVVYSEYLPSKYVRAEHRVVDDILARAATLGAPFVYLLEELRAAKGDPPPYSSTSTHWTHYGAFVAYESTCRALQRAAIDLPRLSGESIAWRPFRAHDDLGGKLEPPRFGPSVRARLRHHRSRLVFDNRVLTQGRTMVFERDDGIGPSAVVFGQSSAAYVLIFLKESFRRLVFVHTCTMPREILERERPDVVLAYPAERFLVRVPDDSSAMRQIAEAIRIKRERGALRDRLGWFLRGIPGADEARDDLELPWEYVPRAA
jgi:hypothetical protein